MRLSDFKALTFDCYGTLIDWEAGMVAALKPLTDRLAPALGRDAILEAHARHESRQQRYTPVMRYSDLLAVVYKRLAEEWAVPVDAEESMPTEDPSATGPPSRIPRRPSDTSSSTTS